MGQLFMVNPPGRKKRRKKPRTAAQKRATKKMLAARKRASASKSTTTRKKKRSVTMARKARKSGKSRKRRTSAKRRSPGVRLVRRGVAVYQGNPRRRRSHGRRKHYSRNPSLLATAKQGVMDALATLGGGAAARIVSNVVPLGNDGIMGAGKGLLVALGVGFGARKFLSADTARFVTAGAMQVPLKNLITSFVPQAGAYLGDYDSIGAYEAMQGYLPGTGTPSADGYGADMGAYEVTY